MTTDYLPEVLPKKDTIAAIINLDPKTDSIITRRLINSG